jgi:hypothetical protein
MASQIEAVYDALEAKVITLDGRAVPTRGLRNPPGALSSGAVPVRILHPYDPRAEGRTFHFRGLGTGQVKGTWAIVDFCAFAPIASPPPLLAMTRYAVAYIEVMKGFRKAGGETNAAIAASLQTWDLKLGVYEWPILSGDFYHGVQVIIDVEEYPL